MKRGRSSKGSLPIVGITVGDAAGIGPEIVLKALLDKSIVKICSPVLIGDGRLLRCVARDFELPINLETVAMGGEIPPQSDKIVCYDLANLNSEFLAGEESQVTGKASAENIEVAVDLCLKKKIDAIATAPISKKAISMAGYNFPGHTEMLSHLTGTDKFAMSFFAGSLCVVLLSVHVSLQEAIALVKRQRVTELIKFTNQTLEKLLKKSIRIAVAGLNPHASEGGMFGIEEAREILPAIEDCQKIGIDVSGPYSPDTVFLRGFRGEFDAVVSCYHDQATIAVKCLSFGESVNVTLGLPIIRTSVDHGTAFDIAGKNIADCSSMKAAIKLAASLATLK